MLMMVTFMLIMIISLTQSYIHGGFVLLLLIHSSTILYDIDYMLQHMSKYPYTVASTTKDSTTATTITTTTTTTLVLDRTHNYTSYHSLLVHLYTVDYWKCIVAIVNNNNNDKNRIGNYNNILASALEARTKKKMKNSTNATSTTIRFSAYNAPHIDSSAKVYMIL